MQIDLHKGDCLEIMKDIPDGSVDLVLTDPPYGTMDTDGGRKLRINGWDKIIPTKPMFEQILRVLRQNGKAALFSQEPYTSKLITEALPSLPFSYRAIWYKNTFGNCLGAKQAMVGRYEDICVFSKIRKEDKTNNPILDIVLKSLAKSGKTQQDAVNLVGASAFHYFSQGQQFRIPTKQKFDILKSAGFFDFDYGYLQKLYEAYNQNRLSELNNLYPSVFNLWQGNKSKSNVLEYSKDNDGFHPTQKPVSLLEDLIQTYSNQGDTVLDFTMGSGTTAIACINTNRNFIGIELDEGYFNIAQERIQAAQAANGR